MVPAKTGRPNALTRMSTPQSSAVCDPDSSPSQRTRRETANNTNIITKRVIVMVDMARLLRRYASRLGDAGVVRGVVFGWELRDMASDYDRGVAPV